MRSMNFPSTQFVAPERMGIYEPIHHIGIWGGNAPESMIITCNPSTSSSIIVPEMMLDNQSEDTSHGTLAPSNKNDREVSKPIDKVQRRLARNREAARKCRLRKKAYVRQLESSRLKLMQLEEDLEKTRQQGLCIGGGLEAGHLGFTGCIKSGIMTFEVQYGHWLEEQNRQICDLRTALNAHINDTKLRVLVENGLNHYSELFRMKAAAAKVDVFYVMLGMWKSSTERFFLWIGGFRPSELLKVLLPRFDPLAEQQYVEFSRLRLLCHQAEDALSQGMDRLQQTLAESVAAGHLGESSYMPQMENAIERVENLVRFVQQADHLRQETLQQMCRFLTTRQAAQCLLVFGEYFQRLRALSSLLANSSS